MYLQSLPRSAAGKLTTSSPLRTFCANLRPDRRSSHITATSTRTVSCPSCLTTTHTGTEAPWYSARASKCPRVRIPSGAGGMHATTTSSVASATKMPADVLGNCRSAAATMNRVIRTRRPNSGLREPMGLPFFTDLWGNRLHSGRDPPVSGHGAACRRPLHRVSGCGPGKGGRLDMRQREAPGPDVSSRSRPRFNQGRVRMPPRPVDRRALRHSDLPWCWDRYRGPTDSAQGGGGVPSALAECAPCLLRSLFPAHLILPGESISR